MACALFYCRAAYFSYKKGHKHRECTKIRLLIDESMRMEYIRLKRVVLFSKIVVMARDIKRKTGWKMVYFQEFLKIIDLWCTLKTLWSHEK